MSSSFLKFSDVNNIAKLAVDMWRNCSNRLRQSTFPNLILFQFFLFRLYIRKFVNSLLNYPQKISLQNFKPLFPLILWIFDLECHGQTSLKVALVKFATFSWNLENWKASTWKTKNSIAIKQKQPPEVFCKKKCS